MNNIVIKEPNRELILFEFIEDYAPTYFSKPDNQRKIDGIKYTQGNKEREIDVLNSSVFDRAGLGKILAWKIGKIKTNGEYASKWENCEERNPLMYGKYRLNINMLLNCLTKYKEDLDKYVEQDRYLDFINRILSFNITGIGPVYAIAILFFYSKGKYPIYDRFAKYALESIKNTRIPERGKSKQMIDYHEEYPKYIELIRPYQAYYQKFTDNSAQINYLRYRDLDRSLWIYGHGFKL